MKQGKLRVKAQIKRTMYKLQRYTEDIREGRRGATSTVMEECKVQKKD